MKAGVFRIIALSEVFPTRSEADARALHLRRLKTYSRVTIRRKRLRPFTPGFQYGVRKFEFTVRGYKAL